MEIDHILQALSFNQTDLDLLASTPPPPRFELSAINTYYGNGENIRRYANLPANEPLPFVIEHFVPLEYDSPHDFDLQPGLPLFLSAHEKRAEAYTKLGMQSTPSGSGIHYAKKLLEADPSWKKPAHQVGTIIFPHKSTRYKDRSFDFEAFAEWLSKLPEQYHPLCVCIYWKDYLQQRHLPYLKRGIPVVSCGHILDPSFLFRFIDLCSRFKYSCGNAIGSSYPFSVLCGCHFFHQDFGGVIEKEGSKPAVHVAEPGATSDLGAQLKKLAPFPPNPDLRKEQQKLANFVTGKKHLLTPSEIRQIYITSRLQLLDRQSTTFSCLHSHNQSDLTPWLPLNIKSDGWSRAHSRLIIKPAKSPRTLTIYIELPEWLFDSNRILRVGQESALVSEIECPPGFHQIKFPLLSDAETPIHFHISPEKCISKEDPRIVSFRFLGWIITNDPTDRIDYQALPFEQLPEFITKK